MMTILHSPTLLTEASQSASDITNVTWNLEVLQFLDDSKKDLEI